jgi:hypothetical protein
MAEEDPPMRPMGLRCGLALMLIATTGSMLLVTIAWSSENALFSGRVFQADGASPHVGVVVALFDDESGKVFRSQPTDDDGLSWPARRSGWSRAPIGHSR